MKWWSYLVLIVIFFGCAEQEKSNSNSIVEDGLEYHSLNISKSTYQVKEEFKLFYISFDPNKYFIDLLFAKDFNQIHLNTNDYIKLSDALLTINASFFDKKFRPLGLQIKNGKKIQDVRKNYDGIFYIKDQVPYIVTPYNFLYDPNITFAIQSRPRLVYHGKPVNLKKQIARRSFIGINKSNHIIIGITEQGKAYADDLAKVLALSEDKGGVGCVYALNLDGGTSSQLNFNYKNFSKNIPGFSGVPNAVAVFEKDRISRHN